MDILQLYKTPHKADKHTEQKLKKFRNPNTLLIKSNFLYPKHQYTHRFPTFIKLYSRGFKSIMKQEKFIKTSANITTEILLTCTLCDKIYKYPILIKDLCK